MKLTKITLNNFRGFPGPVPYAFSLNPSGNLLLYGENGSGKSSLAIALAQFFNPLKNRSAVDTYANEFSGEPRNSTSVTLDFTTGNPPTDKTVVWSTAENSLDDADVRTAASRCLFLDYRSLLSVTSFTEEPEKVLFRAMVEKILAKVEVALPGGVKRIGDLWEVVQTVMADPGKTSATRSKAVNKLNDAVKAKLSEWQQEITAVLKAFRGIPLEVTVAFPGLTYNARKKALEGQVLKVEVRYNQTKITTFDTFLHEASLSAFALALYLAGAKLAAPKTTTGLRLLVLDDILIGLDMANRFPIVELLPKHFPEWQVILMTHNYSWFEAARHSLSSWTHGELFRASAVHKSTGGKYELPVCNLDSPYLDRALQHCERGDLKAAAVYLRTAFEEMLKVFVEQRKLRVLFNSDPRQINTEGFWTALTDYKDPASGNKLIGSQIRKGIEICRSHVLNDVVHFGSKSPNRAEILQAHSLLGALHDLLWPSPAP